MMTDAERLEAIQLHRVDGRLFEDVTTAIYTAWLRPGDTAIDCGANLGHHTRRLAEVVGEAGTVWAIEAVPGLVARLERNLPPPLLARTRIVCAALSDRRMLTDFFYLPDQPGWSSMFESHRPKGSVNAVHLTVPTITLDEFLPIVPSCDFMKIDIENNEFACLKGGPRLLQALAPLIVFEFAGPSAARLTGFSPQQFFAHMDACGYDVLDIFGDPFGIERWADPTVPVYKIAVPQAQASRFATIGLDAMVAGVIAERRAAAAATA